MVSDRPDALDPVVDVQPASVPEFGVEVPEADAVEQAQAVGTGDAADEAGYDAASVATVAFDVDPADAADQRRTVGDDDEDDRR